MGSLCFKKLIYPTPPPAHAQAQLTQAHAHAQLWQAQAQVALWCSGWWDAFGGGGGGGRMAAANFSRLLTMLFEVCSMEVAMLLAKSAPGMLGGLA
jgi:hypothetical protein